MSTDPTDAVSAFCLNVVLGSYKRIVPSGRLLNTSEAKAERDAFLLQWAMSDALYEFALRTIDRHFGTCQRRTLESTVHFGQISGAIDVRETLLQQHITTDPSLFVVDEAVPSKEFLHGQQVVAWTLKFARDEISKSLRSDHGYSKKLLEKRLKVQETASAIPTLKSAISRGIGRFRPGEVAINYARRSKTDLHVRAVDFLRDYDGIKRLAPFALRRIISDTLFDRLGEQRLLELAGGLALAEALAISSGHALKWNSLIASDGIMATVGPFSIGWNKPLELVTDESQSTVSMRETRTGSCISFLQCVSLSESATENETIRLATESLLAACRKEAEKGPRFEETPLTDCAVMMRRFFNYKSDGRNPDRLTIVEFDEIISGTFIELARRACCRASLN